MNRPSKTQIFSACGARLPRASFSFVRPRSRRWRWWFESKIFTAATRANTGWMTYYTTLPVGGWGSPAGCFSPGGVSPRGVWGLLPLRFLCRALQLAIMDVSHTAPSDGSAPDDFVTQGRASRSKRGGSAPAAGAAPSTW